MKRLLALATAAAALLPAALSAGCGSGDSAGEFEASWGGPGTEAGRFVKPRGLAVDEARGAIYVVDMSGRLQKFDMEGGFLGSVALPDSERGTGEGLAVTASGQLLLADTHYHRVLRYGPDLELLGSFGAEGSGPGQMLFPTCVAVDPKGSIYVAGYGDNRVQKFDPAGRYLLGWGGLGREPGQFQRPSGIAVERDGNVLVADASNHRVQRFTPDGRLLAVWGSQGSGPGQFHYPYDLAALPDGGCLVLENYNHRIQRLDAAGRSLGLTGGPGRAPGQFARPWCLAVTAAGRIYVTDTLNHRVQVLRIDLGTPAREAPGGRALSGGGAG